MDVNIDQIKALADLALDKNLAELTVQEGDKSVTIKLPVASTIVTAPPPASYAPPQPTAAPQPAQQAPAAETKASSDDSYIKITAPMVGTYYSSPSPDSPPYVSVGQAVSKGQTLCIIEAMKMMNELESEASGKVVKILVENGQPVEFGQTLMLVDPS